MPKKILLVEDSDTTRLTHRVMIANRTDYEVIAVANGAEALKLTATAKPDLVLMDVMMPGMDGLEVCRRMRKESATSRIPIVLLTFRRRRGIRFRGLRERMYRIPQEARRSRPTG